LHASQDSGNAFRERDSTELPIAPLATQNTSNEIEAMRNYNNASVTPHSQNFISNEVRLLNSDVLLSIPRCTKLPPTACCFLGPGCTCGKLANFGGAVHNTSLRCRVNMIQGPYEVANVQLLQCSEWCTSAKPNMRQPDGKRSNVPTSICTQRLNSLQLRHTSR
jgi:hypothetical protein